MAHPHPHPYDRLIDAHRAGRYLEERQLPVYRDLNFSALHPVHKVPFVALLAAEPNSLAAIKLYLEVPHLVTCWPALGAAMGNQEELLDYLFEDFDDQPPHYNVNNFNWATLGAAKGGHQELLDELLEGGGSLDFAVEGAAWAGNEPLMHKLLDSGAKRERAIVGAARGYQTQLFTILNVQEADYIWMIEGAASGEQRELLLEYSKKELDVFDRWYHQILDAARAEDWALIETLLRGDVVIDRIHPKAKLPVVAVLASEPNREAAVYAFIEAGAHSRWAVLGSALGGQYALTKQLLNRGADINWAVNGAACRGDLSAVNEWLLAGAQKKFAIDGAALGNQATLLSFLLVEIDREKLLALAKGAAEGNHSDLVWKAINVCEKFNKGFLKSVFLAALTGAGRGGNRALAENLWHDLSINPKYNDLIKDDTLNRCLLCSVVRGCYFDWVDSLLDNWIPPYNLICNALRQTAEVGHLAMIHRLLPLNDFESHDRVYGRIIVGAAESGNIFLMEKFLPELEERELEEGWNPNERTSNGAVRLAFKFHESRVVARLMQMGIPITHEDYVAEDFSSCLEITSFLAEMDLRSRTVCVSQIEESEIQDVRRTREMPKTPFEISRLAIGFRISKLMDYYQITAREAQVLYYHRDRLLLIWQLMKNKIGGLHSVLWNYIGCLATTTEECVLVTGEMQNIQHAFERVFAEARILCGPESNFNGNALFVWLQTCANSLKARIWPAQQAIGNTLEALLYQMNINLPGDTLDTELMLGLLQKPNDEGETIQTLLEAANLWEKLLKRFPAFEEQQYIQPTMKRLSSIAPG